MQNVSSISAGACAGLFAAQAVLILVRTRSCVRRPVPLLLAGFLGLLPAHVLLIPDSALHDPVLIALLWAAGAFLIRASNAGMFGMWSGATATLFCSLLIARALGHASSVPYMAFHSFGIALLAALPLGILFRLWRTKHSLSALLTFMAGVLWISLAGIDAVSGARFTVRGPLAGVPELLLRSVCLSNVRENGQ